MVGIVTILFFIYILIGVYMTCTWLFTLVYTWVGGSNLLNTSYLFVNRHKKCYGPVNCFKTCACNIDVSLKPVTGGNHVILL